MTRNMCSNRIILAGNKEVPYCNQWMGLKQMLVY